mmetsp:Transcript_27000/g.77476  ORF Transcript_27000/g.77476 Transcript_27000/m.77476 type:complete len:488 (+) Transcript_27000:148-1611(+)
METAARVAQGIVDGATEVKEKTMSVVNAAADTFTHKRGEYREFLEKYMKIKLRQKGVELIDKIPAFIKKQIEDPYMPGFVRRGIHRAIDTIWPDVKVELVSELQVIMDEDLEAYEEKLELGYKPDCIRAFLRYRLFPFDKGTWYCLRDPIFVVVNVLALIPYMGIYAWMYAFIWVVIDKTDEYQLIYFILSFKGAQFFSWGLVKGIVGFSIYFYCTTFPNMELLLEELEVTEVMNTSSIAHLQNCESHGPGMSEQYWVSVMSWLLPLVLVWISFFLLPWSKEKGRKALKTFEDKKSMDEIAGEHLPSETPTNAQRKAGGYLRKMLIVDFVIFCLCVALMAIIVRYQPEVGGRSRWHALYNAADDDWQVKQTLFFCQFIYGLFSIVFVPFVLPFLQAVLTHSAPTAYNEFGQCCKFKGAAPMAPAKAEGEDDNNNKHITEEEDEGIMTNFKNIANGQAVNMEVFKRGKEKSSADGATPESGGQGPERV